MDTQITRVAELLHEAAETHHCVYHIVDGADDDWASWYGDWLLRLSELPQLLGRLPVRSELVYLLVLAGQGRRRTEAGGGVGDLLRASDRAAFPPEPGRRPAERVWSAHVLAHPGCLPGVRCASPRFGARRY